MDSNECKNILDKIIGQVFGVQNPFANEQILQKFAFDIRLPQQVYDSTTNEPTWSQSTSPAKFITIKNARKRNSIDDWIIPKKPLKNIDDILSIWPDTNFMTTERSIESINSVECDNIYYSENIYRSQDCNQSKNLVFCDGIQNSEFVAAGQRSNSLSFCLRIEDSKESSNCFSVVWSGKVTNSYFIQDCYDISDCMFCSHIASKQYCIANMQFTKDEYEPLKQAVIQWIFSKN